MLNLPEVYVAAHEIADLFDSLIERANVQDSGEARISACISLTIAEQFRATLCLLEGHCETHAPEPIRSMLEGLADLINLLDDPIYLNQLRWRGSN